jgi:hypothetical protein
MGNAMTRLLREPLLHFLLLGAGLFVAYDLMSTPGSDGPAKIVVTQGQIEHLVSSFTNAWRRPPTSEELAGLIRDHVREEVYYREAMAMGLDRDDTVIRRRLRQKMEFITDDIAAIVQPTDAELGAYLTAHPEMFRSQQLFTFSHVYLNPEKHGANLVRDATQLRDQLNRAGGNADVSALGDSFLLEHTFTAAPGSEIAQQFGEAFTATLGEVPLGEWQGPVNSGYGAHLVFVRECTERRVPDLSEVRDAVAREWGNARRQEANEKYYQELLKRYTVTVERPGPLGASEVAANDSK